MSAHAGCNVNQHDQFVWGPCWPREEGNWRVTGPRLLQRHRELHKETVRTHPGAVDPQVPHVAAVFSLSKPLTGPLVLHDRSDW